MLDIVVHTFTINYVHIIIEINTLIATSSRVCYTVEYIIDVMHLSLCQDIVVHTFTIDCVFPFWIISNKPNPCYYTGYTPLQTNNDKSKCSANT